jgi:hypothetical protein
MESEKSNLCQKLYIDVSTSVRGKSSLRGARNVIKALLTVYICNILWFPGSSAEVWE